MFKYYKDNSFLLNCKFTYEGLFNGSWEGDYADNVAEIKKNMDGKPDGTYKVTYEHANIGKLKYTVSIIDRKVVGMKFQGAA